MNKELQVGDVVQINPQHDPVFGGCFMVVDELKSWGARGYVKICGLGDKLAYYRCGFENMTKIGKAEWGLAVDEQDTESAEESNDG